MSIRQRHQKDGIVDNIGIADAGLDLDDQGEEGELVVRHRHYLLDQHQAVHQELFGVDVAMNEAGFHE